MVKPKNVSNEAWEVAGNIIDYVESKSDVRVNKDDVKKVIPKAEGIYHTIKMIMESDLKSLNFLKSAIEERIKILSK